MSELQKNSYGGFPYDNYGCFPYLSVCQGAPIGEPKDLINVLELTLTFIVRVQKITIKFTQLDFSSIAQYICAFLFWGAGQP